VLAGEDPKLDRAVRCREAAPACGPALGAGWQAALTHQEAQGTAQRGTAGLVWGLSNSFGVLPGSVSVIHTYLMNCSIG